MTRHKTSYSYLPSFLARMDFLGIFEKDCFGNSLTLKRLLVSVLGWFTYYRHTAVNKISITGTEHLADLPDEGVLFLSNHQTYFADVIAFFQIFGAVKWGYKNTISPPFYLFSPRVRLYYVAASETMLKGGILPRLFSLCGAILVDRTWRAGGEHVSRHLDSSAQSKVKDALDHGWVISFPQGTTRLNAPVRKGTAYMIRDFAPVVIPVVIEGFDHAFDKKGLRFKKRNTQLKVRFKSRLHFEPGESVEMMTERIRIAIEQGLPEDDGENIR